MELRNLADLLVVYALTASACWTWRCLKAPSLRDLAVLLALLGTLGTTTLAAAYSAGENNYLLVLTRSLRADRWTVVALALGFVLGLLWLVPALLLPRPKADAPEGSSAAWWVCGACALGAFFATGAVLVRNHFPSLLKGNPLADRRFQLEPIAKLPDEPIAIIVTDDETVYTTVDHFLDGREIGQLWRIKQNAEGQWTHQNTIREHLFLCRPFGLAERGGDLFVSRSGRMVKAVHGRLEFQSTGAVTRLRDLDGDGVFDDFEDILTDLPGPQHPDSQHSNNGLAFAADGSLYVGVGSPGNREIPKDPREGSIQRILPDFKSSETFARGFRNPFALTIGPNGALFVTSNDLDDNPGDEIDHVVAGGHYGHPHTHPGENLKVPGYTDPIYLGSKEGNLVGLAYCDSPKLPEEYRKCLFVTDLSEGEVIRVKIEPDGDTYKVVESSRFLKIQSPVGVAVSPAGVIYVATRRPDNRVYRIRFQG